MLLHLIHKFMILKKLEFTQPGNIFLQVAEFFKKKPMDHQSSGIMIGRDENIQ